MTNNIGASLIANDYVWTPSRITNGAEAAIGENEFGANVTFIGTCYGKYDFNEV